MGAGVRGRRVVAGSVLLLLLSSAVPGQEPPPKPVPGSADEGTLVGRIEEASDRRPVAGRVVATSADGRTWSAAAGADGRFRIEGLPRGAWVSVEAAAPGLATSDAREMEIPLVGDRQTGPLSLRRTADLRVKVLNEPGRPVPGAAIAARRPLAGNLDSGPMPLEPWPEAARATAGEDGNAVLEDLPPGEGALFVTAPGFARGRRLVEHSGESPDPPTVVLRPRVVRRRGGRELRIAEGAPTGPGGVFDFWVDGEGEDLRLDDGEEKAGIEIVLHRGWEVGGVVRTDAGAPADEAEVFVTPAGAGFHPGRIAPGARTDAGGRFRVEGLAEGRYDLRIHMEDRPDAFLTVDAGATDLRVVLERGFAIQGRVLDADTGRPVGGLPVSAEHERELRFLRFERREATTAADGTFTIRGLREGPCDLSLGDEFEVRHRSPYPPKRVRGVAAGAKDLVLESGDEPVKHWIDPAEDGTFEVRGLPPGPAVLRLDRGAPPGLEDPEIARIRIPCEPLDLRAPDDEER